MLVIHAEHRKKIGTKNSRKLRRQNKCPGVIYGKQQPNITIIINQNIISNIQRTNDFYKKTIEIIINNNQRYITKICHIQYHPFKKTITHIDFLYQM
ncbi:50S ribosomal protein L25 [Blochmannia endosymbiont of Polyrhachis (Hedomyrma) turneri]|uniref:50S ribosomal protein L25 n=1 Tax=Blochmannia endosymbiont of Polyrhachis (Hedomyrma) turneri TaxID=1505596 RepID=UPI00061A711B|nr:50S ribosomal protein L25 [Blochmannia endosymbiont of Polyrhachis (Hedomyrma) turneri]AKC60035.1 50S ribosomal protein L25 [Blochmannia endosymbiont of Polyrhachis (Hedomyrma) turneri]